MQKIESEQQFKEWISREQPTVVVFKADWCKDCVFINPFMPEVEQAYARSFTFVTVDRDEFPDLCAELNILGIPSFIVYKNGKELIRFVSKLRKTREEIEKFLDRAQAVAEMM